MNCPYCGGQMQPGHLRCSKGSPIWYGDGDQVSSLDRVLGGMGTLTAAKQAFWDIRIPANYCHTCKKLIIDTTISK